MQREALLTKRELADRLRVSTRTIDRLRLPCLWVGGQNRHRMSEIEAVLKQERADVAAGEGNG